MLGRLCINVIYKCFVVVPAAQGFKLFPLFLPFLVEKDILVLSTEMLLLIQVPSLGNQVLLSHLCLNENSITSVSSLTQQWLPHLQSLHVSQNRYLGFEQINFLWGLSVNFLAPLLHVYTTWLILHKIDWMKNGIIHHILRFYLLKLWNTLWNLFEICIHLNGNCDSNSQL